MWKYTWELKLYTFTQRSQAEIPSQQCGVHREKNNKHSELDTKSWHGHRCLFHHEIRWSYKHHFCQLLTQKSRVKHAAFLISIVRTKRLNTERHKGHGSRRYCPRDCDMWRVAVKCRQDATYIPQITAVIKYFRVLGSVEISWPHIIFFNWKFSLKKTKLVIKVFSFGWPSKKKLYHFRRNYEYFF